MHPDLQFFLEDTFKTVEPTAAYIGRAVVEPDYEADVDLEESSALRQELIDCLLVQSPLPGQLKDPDGYEVTVPSKYPVLTKYIRRITLREDRVEGPWVEVAPPGNWI
jgi:hypothetical protein